MSKLTSYARRNWNKPIGHHSRSAGLYLKSRVKYRLDKFRALFGVSVSDRGLFSALGGRFGSIPELAEHFRTRSWPRFFLSPRDREQMVDSMEKLYPGSMEAAVKEAVLILKHVFSLLGSGPVNLGPEIDWHRDFKSGYKWPRSYYEEIEYRDYQKGYDVKVPRELSRFHHLVPLGKAYWSTGDERYALEFVSQLTDWTRENPPGIGVNWQSTMDVAIRVVNWIWGFYFFCDVPSISDEFIALFLKNCLLHGRHIRNNLEWDEVATTNHYVSDLVGLAWLGMVFPEFREAKEWLDFSRSELEHELEKQVYPDGMHYEASTCYHRLVVEMYFTTLALADMNGHAWSDRSREIIRRMFDAVRGIIKPDGTVPQFGDNDSGRLLVTAPRKPLDQAWLMPVAAVMFDDGSFKHEGIPFPEEAFWLFGQRGYDAYAAMPAGGDLTSLPSRSFENGGIYVMRSGGHCCAVSSGPNGQNGNGGHAHNDKLGFEMCSPSGDLVIDPGTGVYSSDARMRNLFRSTRSHNTVMVDGEEMNEFDEGKLFQLHDRTRARMLAFGDEGKWLVFVGEHSGYERLADPVVHRRGVFFDKEQLAWYVCDALTGRGPHRFELFLHFPPDCILTDQGEVKGGRLPDLPDEGILGAGPPAGMDGRSFSLSGGGTSAGITVLSSLPLEILIEDGRVSPEYGVLTAAPVLAARARGPCPALFLSVIEPK